MLQSILSANSLLCRYAAWLTVLVLFVLAATAFRNLFVAILLKVYEILVQKNAMP